MATGWMKLSDAGKQIGVPMITISKHIQNSVPPEIEVRIRGGKRCVDVYALHAHFKAQKKLPRYLHEPDEPEAIKKSDPVSKEPKKVDKAHPYQQWLDPEIVEAMDGKNPMEVSPMEMAQRVSLAAGVSAQQKANMLKLAESCHRMQMAELRSGGIKTDRVRAMIKAHANLIKAQTEAYKTTFAEELNRYISRAFPGVNLLAKRPDAIDLLVVFYLEHRNGFFGSLDELINEQMSEIREVEVKAQE